MNAWAVPYVTGHKYKVHWRYGLDFWRMNMTLSPRWKKTDLPIEFEFNFTDIRAAIDVMTPSGNATNGTLLNLTAAKLSTGDNVLFNDTANRTFRVHANGANANRNPVRFVAYRCIGDCLAAINDTAVEDTPRFWSDIASWETLGRLPVDGEDVEILPGWNMVYDLTDSPVFRKLEINGRLSFLDDGVNDRTLRSKHIFVRAG
jgi:hypothetical protein